MRRAKITIEVRNKKHADQIAAVLAKARFETCVLLSADFIEPTFLVLRVEDTTTTHAMATIFRTIEIKSLFTSSPTISMVEISKSYNLRQGKTGIMIAYESGQT